MHRAYSEFVTGLRESALKFAEEVNSVAAVNARAPDIPQPVALDSISSALQVIQAKQDVQFRILNGSLERVGDLMSRIVTLLESNSSGLANGSHEQTIHVDVQKVIPEIHPTANISELKDVRVNVGGRTTVLDSPPTPDDVDQEDEEVAKEQVVEAEEVVEEEVEEEEVVEEEVEEEEVVEEEVAEEEVVEEEGDEDEVEEWTYKGRKYFKGSDNVVYANVNDDVGEALGVYDPATNKVKPLPK